MSKERVNIYLNTEIALEKAMWEYINKDGKKSYTIKKAIEMAMRMDGKDAYINHPVQVFAQDNTGHTEKDDTKQIEQDEPSNVIKQDNTDLSADDIPDDIFA